LTMERQEAVAGVVRELGAWPAGTVISKNALARMFHRHPVSIMRAVDRGELPPPIRLFGKGQWTAGALLSHLEARQKMAVEGRREALAKGEI